MVSGCLIGGRGFLSSGIAAGALAGVLVSAAATFSGLGVGLSCFSGFAGWGSWVWNEDANVAAVGLLRRVVVVAMIASAAAGSQRVGRFRFDMVFSCYGSYGII